MSDCSSKLLKTYIGDVRCDAGRVSEDTSDLVTVGSSNTVRFGLIRKFPTYFRVSRNGSWIIVPVLSSPSCLVTHLGLSVFLFVCLSVCDPDLVKL